MPITPLTLNGKSIGVREDGFVDATQLCELGKKRMAQWRVNSGNVKLMEALTKQLKDESGQDVKVYQSTQGVCGRTWVHPLLVVPIASWVSPTFTLTVSRWVEEWKQHSAENITRFNTALADLEPSHKNQREAELRDKYKALLGADTEVKTPVGFIDLLTPTELIELKVARKWKHGVGQLICYGAYHEDHALNLYLFDHTELSDTEKDEITRICVRSRITVKYLDDVIISSPDADDATKFE